jgi:DNA-binding transcriptional LysR family regulator
MNWDNLRFFLAVAEADSVRGAAAVLRVDHATVSRRLRTFQNELGVRLLERIAGGYQLTAEGEQVLSLARTMRDQIEALNLRIAGRDTRLSGQIRLTIPEALTEYMASDLASFLRTYPDIRIEIADVDTSLNLTQREADIALRFSAAPPETLVGRRVWPGVLTAPYAAHEIAAKVASGDSLYELPWVDWDHAFSQAPHVRWVRKRVAGHRIVARVHSTSMLRQLVREGVGAGLMFCGFGEPDDRLVRLGPPLPEVALDLWVLTHAELRASARIRTCMNALVDSLRARAQPFRLLGDGVG